MFFPRKEIVDSIKKEYPVGTRVALVSMNDPYRNIPAGEKGEVIGVDDTGTIHVNWDCGGCLGIVYGEDSCRKIPEVTVECYGKKEVWENKEKALEFYMQAVAGCEGHEQLRYIAICEQLKEGNPFATDEGV